MLEVTCWSAATGSSSTSFRDLSVSDHAHSDAANMPAGVLVTDGMVPAGLAGLAVLGQPDRARLDRQGQAGRTHQNY